MKKIRKSMIHGFHISYEWDGIRMDIFLDINNNLCNVYKYKIDNDIENVDITEEDKALVMKEVKKINRCVLPDKTIPWDKIFYGKNTRG